MPRGLWTLVARLLPRGVQERFGDELRVVIARRSADARRRGGRRAQLIYLCREGWDLCRLAVESRRGPAPAEPASSDRRPHLLDSALADLRWTVRQIRRRPLHAAAVSGTLALTIAATTTAYGLARAVLWRPLPFTDASRLVFVWERSDTGSPMRVTAWRYGAWRDGSSAFASMALFGAAGYTVDDPDGPVSIRGVRVSAGYFDTLGLSPALGRVFTADDEQPGRDHVVVLSHAFWQQRFGGRPDAIGRVLRFNGEPYTVVGVMPPVVSPGWPVNPAAVMLDGDSRQIWVPIARTPALEQNAGSHVFGVVARLAGGVSRARAGEELNAGVIPGAPDDHGATLTPLREQFVGTARLPLLLLVAASTVVLLIACANLAALQVTTFELRRREFGIRSAIGAGWTRLAAQLVIESLALALVGGLLGTVLSAWALAVLPGWLPASVPFLTAPELDLPVAMVAVGAAMATALALAAWPIARLVGVGASPRAAVTIAPRRTVYRTLVAAQVAITVALVVCAGLLAQSFSAVQRQDPGFVVDGVLTADVALSPQYRDARSLESAARRVQDAVATRPRVAAVALAYDHPLEANWSGGLELEGRAEQARGAAPLVPELRIVSPEYFDALGVEVLDGRAFTRRDDVGAPGVALVNEAFARAVGGRMLGRRVHADAPRFTFGDAVPTDFTIVGVAEDERFRGLEQPALPAVYLSVEQFPQQEFSLLVRTDADPLALVPDVRAVIREAEPTAALSRPASLAGILAAQLAERHVTTNLVSGFAMVALGLAVLGLYGLLAVFVSTRTREIGIRLALGAAPGGIRRRVVGESLACVAVGIASGLALAVLAGRVVASLLVGVTAHDAPTLAAVAAVLVVAAIAAAVAPARRAANIDPIAALRQP
jgi:putative ABC transport system permease protein